MVSLKEKSVLLYLHDDQICFLKAALQSEDNAKLVGKLKNHAAAFKEELDDEKMVKTIEALLSDENLAETLQIVLEDKYLVWILKESLKLNDPLYPKSRFFKGHVTLKPSKVDFFNSLQMLVKDNEKSQLIKASLEDDVDLKLWKSFRGSKTLKLVEDMLGRTQLDTVQSLKRFSTIRRNLVLDDKKRFSKHKNELADEEWMGKFDALLEDMNLVFFLGVAIKDDGRAKLFRAALRKKTGEGL
ncbi:uncharacterized protein PHALS_08585 [Plasmopara halstedii]|uniref:Uncharacterized protein n=1 Tax=Plasmopara halstedii TaxID=4781 RepID=A0A0P1AC94_PLAHL|nr:uncharacterized protein PHALS_08585 [Plasmopara halstedii]CEG38516.1 hypothetical protein PHALS_08585 [Plasmopara halstedii]|eukprot:XP_024574885.1 hypothetical protein PHALS_08585 [Plasmopara halstedii]